MRQSWHVLLYSPRSREFIVSSLSRSHAQLLSQSWSPPLVIFSITSCIVLLGGLALFAVDEDEEKTIFLAFVKAWQFMIDTGALGNEVGLPTYPVAFVIVTCGLFTLSILIAFVSESLTTKMENLRKPRSTVVEEGSYPSWSW